MKRFVVFGVALFLSAGAAFAQGKGQLTLTPDQERDVYQTLTRERVKAPPPADWSFGVGAPVPKTVRLYNVPRNVKPAPMRRYRYTVARNRVVVVEPVTTQNRYADRRRLLADV